MKATKPNKPAKHCVDFRNPDYLPVINERIARLKLLRSDAKLLAAAKEHYRHNPVDFIEDWVWTNDPRKDGENQLKDMPFLLFPKQKQYIKWLVAKRGQRKDGLVEKSRDAGVSWMNMAFGIWLWIFEPGVQIGYGSATEKKIDRIGDMDSIFEKGRYILRKLPPEFLPTFRDHRNGVWRSYNEAKDAPHLKILNRGNGSALTGESGDNIGRGGRSSMYFKDESAFYERPEKVDAALSQNSNVKIDCSTPNGNGNPFYQKRHGGKIDVFTFNWREDPRKDEKWYQHQKDTLTPAILAQEVDIDYNASVEGILILSKWVQAAINIKLEASGQKISALDVANNDGGGDGNVYTCRHGSVVTNIESWGAGTPTESTRKAVRLCKLDESRVLKYDSIGVGAGVKGEGWSIQQSEPHSRIQFIGYNAGSTKLPGLYKPGRKNKDMFANAKARDYWCLRDRFENTWEHVNGIKTHKPDDMISIPNHAQLVAELSQVMVKENSAGKIIIESKDQLKARGISSPDHYESLVICFSQGGGTDLSKLTSM